MGNLCACWKEYLSLKVEVLFIALLRTTLNNQIEFNKLLLFENGITLLDTRYYASTYSKYLHNSFKTIEI